MSLLPILTILTIFTLFTILKIPFWKESEKFLDLKISLDLKNILMHRLLPQTQPFLAVFGELLLGENGVAKGQFFYTWHFATLGKNFHPSNLSLSKVLAIVNGKSAKQNLKSIDQNPEWVCAWKKRKNELVKLHFLASYQSSTVHNLASPRFERKTQIGRFPLQQAGANSEEQFVYPSWFDWPLLAFSTNLIDSTRWGRLKEQGFSGNLVK